MYKKLLFIGMVLIIQVQLHSQNIHTIKGDILYESYSYQESIVKYEGITDKTIEVKRKLAHAYYNIQNFIKSEEYFLQLVNSDNRTDQDVYNYASILLINKKYKEAEKWMKIYNKSNITDSRGIQFANNVGFYKKLLEDKNQFAIKNLNINSEQSDFGTSYFKNKIAFASTKQQTKFINRKWNWNKMPYLNIYTAEVIDDDLSHIKSFKNKINKKYHDGPASFNGEGTFMVFTRNNYLNTSKDGVVKLQLYFSELKDGKWQTPNPFLYNSKEYSYGHAALTPDGKTMFLASDMPGGFGGVDLYKSELDENGSWSAPINLGAKINTEGNEMFPFIHEDGYLFFASNGLLGLGGLDVFMSKVNDKTFSKPINVGIPINSSTDDFAFIIDKEMKSGYFSSNREGGKGSDDIYSFNLLKPFGINLIGIAKDDEGNRLANTKVTLYNSEGESVESIITDSTGGYSFPVDADTEYKLLGKKDKFYECENNVSTKGIVGELTSDVVLLKIPNFSFYCTVKDKKTNDPIDSVNVILLNKDTKLIDEYLTSKFGDFTRVLENKKLNDVIDYKLVFTKEGYMVTSVNYNQFLIAEGKQELLVLMDKIEVGMNLNDIIKINPIYFDLNKSNIRPDAAIELDKIVKVMNENPKMVIELGSHTDSRGSDTYNRKLSDRRAKSSAKYIQERISNPKNIYGKGYGESQLKNHCKNGVKCSKEEHQENRRTEFKIIKR